MPITPSTKRARAGQLVKLERNKRKGLDSPKMSLLQSQINENWNVADKGVTRGGTRTPNTHDGRVQEGKAKMTA